MERQPIEAEYPLSKGGQKLCYFLPQDRTEGKVGLFRDLERLHLHASTDPQVICISTERPASQRSGARPTKSRDPPCQPSCRYSFSRAIEMVTTRQYMPSKPHMAILRAMYLQLFLVHSPFFLCYGMLLLFTRPGKKKVVFTTNALPRDLSLNRDVASTGRGYLRIRPGLPLIRARKRTLKSFSIATVHALTEESSPHAGSRMRLLPDSPAWSVRIRSSQSATQNRKQRRIKRKWSRATSH
ncbi:hypothetical protein CH063_03756 [Colletotrichum higginsianum]|uniref:Uncharacterized protein n=1 Tax=Colletotrichum higginsianum (strain IMI 349063) TaxID=759273 RepID=H1W0J2_COLHI|nr:hypothetical protein CH063_03756 [Colletotrichum higginsianum]